MARAACFLLRSAGEIKVSNVFGVFAMMLFGKMHRDPGVAAFTQNLNGDRGHPALDTASSTMARHH